MIFLDKLAERHIREAALRGEFDHLPGAGKPLKLDDDSQIPAELRTAYRLLKNAGYLPPELQLNRDIKEAEQLLACVRDPETRGEAERRLHALRLRLSMHRGAGIDFVVERQYRERLLQRL